MGNGISGCAWLRQAALYEKGTTAAGLRICSNWIKHTIPGYTGQNLGLSVLLPKGKRMLLYSGPKTGSHLWAAKSSLAALDSGVWQLHRSQRFPQRCTVQGHRSKHLASHLDFEVPLSSLPYSRGISQPVLLESPIVPNQGEAHVREPSEDDWDVCPHIPLLHPVTSSTWQLHRKATTLFPITAQPASGRGEEQGGEIISHQEPHS